MHYKSNIHQRYWCVGVKAVLMAGSVLIMSPCRRCGKRKEKEEKKARLKVKRQMNPLCVLQLHDNADGGQRREGCRQHSLHMRACPLFEFACAQAGGWRRAVLRRARGGRRVSAWMCV